MFGENFQVAKVQLKTQGCYDLSSAWMADWYSHNTILFAVNISELTPFQHVDINM